MPEDNRSKKPQRTKTAHLPGAKAPFYPKAKPKGPPPPEVHNQLKLLRVHKPKGRAKAEDVAKFNKLKNELRLTYAAVIDKFDGWKYFTERHFKFAQAYARNGRTSVVKAMKEAGYDYGRPDNIKMMGQRALTLHGMEELISAFELEEKARMKLNVEDVVDWFRKIATAAMDTGDFTNANRAMENLGKYLGMFVEKREITHKVVHNKQELDDRIAELTGILKEAEPELEAKLRIH